MRALLRKHICLTLILTAAAAMLWGCPTGDISQIIIFKDANLERAVRAELGQPFGFLTITDLQRLSSLDARSLKIRDLSGLEWATELQWLDLDTNEISDITALGNLTKMEVLNLDGNQIFDIKPIQNMSDLRSLSVFDNQVADIKPLVALAEFGWGQRVGAHVVLDARTLNDEALNVDVPRLRQLGVNVVLAEAADSSDSSSE